MLPNRSFDQIAALQLAALFFRKKRYWLAFRFYLQAGAVPVVRWIGERIDQELRGVLA